MILLSSSKGILKCRVEAAKFTMQSEEIEKCFKSLAVLLTLFLSSGFLFISSSSQQTEPAKIQLALLLDVSGSMDQLIVKTKSQFWQIANYLDRAKKKGKTPTVEFGLIIYGGEFGPGEGHIKILSDLTYDF